MCRHSISRRIEGIDLPQCEVDFVVIYFRTYPDKPALIIGECKDEGDQIDRNDVENLKRIADAIPARRFDTYILLARLSPFSEAEIGLAKTLNDERHQRAIFLSARELEPYHLYDRANQELGTKFYGISPEDMARATVSVYSTSRGMRRRRAFVQSGYWRLC